MHFDSLGLWIAWLFIMIIVLTGRIPRWLQIVIVLAALASCVPYVIGCAVICLR